MKFTMSRAGILKNFVHIRIYYPPSRQGWGGGLVHLTCIYSPPSQWGYNDKPERDMVSSLKKHLT